MTLPRTPALPSPRTAPDVVDLHVLRMGGERALAAMAAAPVRHLPVALLDALHGAWGTPEELGLVRLSAEPRLTLVAG